MSPRDHSVSASDRASHAHTEHEPAERTQFTMRSLDEAWPLSSGSRHHLRVRTGHYQVHCELRHRADATRLLVVFHGARNNGPDTQPQLVCPSWAKQIQAHLLLISDPTAERPWPGILPRASMYIGTLAQPLAEELNALIDHAARTLRVDPDQTVLYGLSSGGAAALLVGSQRQVARVITSNAMAHFDSLPRRLVDRALMGLACGAEAVAEARRREPWRFDPCTAWRHGLSQGRDLRLVIGQSHSDRSTFIDHFPQLCLAAGIQSGGAGISTDGRAVALLHHDPGHANEPPLRLIRVALSTLARPDKALRNRRVPGLPPGCFELPDAQQARMMPTALRPLRAAATSGRLLVCGPPVPATRALRPLLMDNPAVWLGLERYRARCNNGLPLSDSLFTPERLSRYEVDEVPPGSGPQAPNRLPEDWRPLRWVGDTLPTLHRRYLTVLRDLPQGRIVYLAVDATTTLRAVATVAAREATPPDAASLRARLLATLDEWRHQVRQTALALRKQGDRIFVIDLAHLLPNGELALRPLLDWLSLEATATLTTQLKHYRARCGKAVDTQAAVDETLLARLTPNDQAAWQYILAHSRRECPSGSGAQAPK